MNWIIDGFDSKAWDAIKETIYVGRFINGNDYFGAFKCGALCFDIVLRDVDEGKYFLCADAYLLGLDNGYAYTKNGTPYDEDDSVCLEYDLEKSYEEMLASFIKQLDKAVDENQVWNCYANSTNTTWEKEEE